MNNEKFGVIFIFILFFVSSAYAHDVPYSTISLQSKDDILQLDIVVPIFCDDKNCESYSLFNYSKDYFSKNLTIKQGHKYCEIIDDSFSQISFVPNSIEVYYLSYKCPSKIDSVNISNTLFYEKTGYYFEQYYVVNCSGGISEIYSDLFNSEINYNYSKICNEAHSINSKEKSKVDITLGNTQNLFDKIIEMSKERKFLFLFVIFSLFLGILHSFAPGHGKSLILSYIIGHKLSKKDIAKLSLTTAFTHILDVLLLSLIFLFIPLSLKNKYIDGITFIAALLIIFFGINFLFKNLNKKHPHSHHHYEHSHKPRKRNLYSLGILAGLAPCPTAWLLFSILISLNLYFQAVISLIFFSLGLISTIVIISILFLYCKPLLRFIPEEFKGYKILKLVSSILIILIGIIMLFRVVY